MRFRIATAALSAALAAPALAADPPCPKCEATCPAPAAGAVVKVFAVADLVTPVPDFAFPPAPGPARPMPAPPIAVAMERVAVQPARLGLAVPPPSGLAGCRDVLLPAPVGAAQGAFFRTMTLPTPVAVMTPCAGVAACPAAACDEVPPGGVRVVRAESPTTLLIGGLKTCEPRRRCWTLNDPDNGFHLDVLPSIPDLEYPPTGILLTDKELFHWQHSDPIGYARWFRKRSQGHCHVNWNE